MKESENDNKEQTLAELNKLLAFEYQAINQYMAHIDLHGIQGIPHILSEEEEHATMLIKEIKRLKGSVNIVRVPDLSISNVLVASIRKDIAGERVAVGLYRNALSIVHDPLARKVIKYILEEEEEHIEELLDIFRSNT